MLPRAVNRAYRPTQHAHRARDAPMPPCGRAIVTPPQRLRESAMPYNVCGRRRYSSEVRRLG